MSKPCRHFLLLIAWLAIFAFGSRVNAQEEFAKATRLYQAGQWQQAAELFDRLSQPSQQENSTRLKAQLHAGECYMQLNKYAEARQRYQLVHQQHPPIQLAAQTLFRLGEVAWFSGDVPEAALLLNSYLEKYPLGANISYAQDYLAQIARQKKSQADFDSLDQAVGLERDGRRDAALAAYKKLLRKQHLHGKVRSETLRRMARLQARLADHQAALRLYQQFLVENPHSKYTAEVIAAVAWLHDQLDQTTQAADQFRSLHAKFPQSAQAVDAAYWLAKQSADEQDNEQSMRYADWLLANETLPTLRPSLWGKTLCLKCQLAAGKGRWQQINDMLAEVDQDNLDQGSPRTKLEFWKAEAAFRLRQYDVARSRFSALQTQIIGINQPWTAMVPLRRAQLAARRQQWTSVLQILDQLELDYPEFELDYEVDYLRGRALAGRGTMTAARKFYRRVLENPQAIDTEAATMAGWMIGETFFHQRDYTRARGAYKQVMQQTKLVDWQSRAALQAGKCWELEQRWDKAAGVYSTALKRWPSSASKEQLESRLRWAESQSNTIQR